MLVGLLWTGPMGRVTGRRDGEVGDAAVVVEWVGRALVVGGGMLSWCGMGCALGAAGLLGL
jgi:hypothetical protein